MRGAINRAMAWAKTPSGQRTLRHAVRYAQSPEGKRRIAQAREKGLVAAAAGRKRLEERRSTRKPGPRR